MHISQQYPAPTKNKTAVNNLTKTHMVTFVRKNTHLAYGGGKSN